MLSHVKHTLEFDSLYLEFGLKRVLSDVYVKCETGEVVGMLGRNGCGKSCLMQIVFGTLKPYMKSVRIDQVPLNSMQPAVSYLPQDHFIPSFLTVRKALELYGVNTNEFVQWAPDCKKLLSAKAGELAGGERRLLEIYLILSRPSLFTILDEPFSFLMPLHVERVKQLIEEKKATKGIIVTDHLYEHILDLSDRLYLLREGKTHLVKGIEQLSELGYLR